MKKVMEKQGILKAVLNTVLVLGIGFPSLAVAKEITAGRTQTKAAIQVAAALQSETETETKKEDLTDVSLESLMGLNVQVVSSSKRAESLRDATSAIFVITQEEIRRSGARSIPDLLVMVPGVQVARQSSNEWAISARGFNGQYNNKMLVLIDGRSVYDPIMGGVNWNQQDVMLEDVDHIEVIRGPGGTLWGANAVNGIVNILTKDSKITQGLYVTAQGGANLYAAGTTSIYSLNGLGAFRYGGKLGDDFYYRIYGQTENRNPFANPKADVYQAALNNTWNDDWYDFRGGFRTDWHSDEDQLTLEGEIQKGYFNYARLTTSGIAYFDANTFATGNDLNTDIDQNEHFLARWTRDFKDDSQVQIQGYYDYNSLTKARDTRNNNVGQLDFEGQHRFHLGQRNEITWGGSYRKVSDQFLNPINTFYDPQNQELNILGGFLQDKLTVVEGKLFLTAGAKLENNTYTGDEFSPSARLLFTPDNTTSLWAAVSRAVRIPTQFSETSTTYLGGIPADFFGPGFPPVNTYGAVIPNGKLLAETLVSSEVGFRTNPTKETSLDVAGFNNQYERLIAFQPLNGTFASPAGGVVDSSLYAYQQQNTGMGRIYGVEIAGQWTPVKALKLNLSYTYQDFDANMIAASNTELGAPPPHNLANGRVSFSPIPEIEFNTAFYYTDKTYMYDPNSGNSITPDYVQWNLGATVKSGDHLEVSVWGLDLEGAHTETLPTAFISPAQVVPSVYGQVTVRY